MSHKWTHCMSLATPHQRAPSFSSNSTPTDRHYFRVGYQTCRTLRRVCAATSRVAVFYSIADGEIPTERFSLGHIRIEISPRQIQGYAKLRCNHMPFPTSLTPLHQYSHPSFPHTHYHHLPRTRPTTAAILKEPFPTIHSNCARITANSKKLLLHWK
jgi:hypothetical protein